MSECKNCNESVLYGDEVCPDCGRENNDDYLWGKQNVRTVTIHYFELAIEKALFKVEKNTGIKINAYEMHRPQIDWMASEEMDEALNKWYDSDCVGDMPIPKNTKKCVIDDYYEVIHVGTGTIIWTEGRTYPDRSELGSDLIEWGLERGLLTEDN